MIVRIKDEDGSVVNLEDTDFVPPSLGDFLSAAINRRELSFKFVSEKTGIPEQKLQGIINNDQKLDKTSSKKLERVFPKCSKLFLDIQRFSDYFNQYGVLRPDSPIKRAVIERNARAAGKVHKRDVEFSN